MDSTDTLLLILITLLSTILIGFLITALVVLLLIRRLVIKIRRTVDLGNETISLLRARLMKGASFFALIKTANTIRRRL